MSPVPQLDWPKDLYSTPWKDIEDYESEHPFKWVSLRYWQGMSLLAICVAAPFVTVAYLSL